MWAGCWYDGKQWNDATGSKGFVLSFADILVRAPSPCNYPNLKRNIINSRTSRGLLLDSAGVSQVPSVITVVLNGIKTWCIEYPPPRLPSMNNILKQILRESHSHLLWARFKRLIQPMHSSDRGWKNTAPLPPPSRHASGLTWRVAPPPGFVVCASLFRSKFTTRLLLSPLKNISIVSSFTENGTKGAWSFSLANCESREADGSKEWARLRIGERSLFLVKPVKRNRRLKSNIILPVITWRLT